MCRESIPFPAPGPTSVWERLLLGLDQALESFRAANPNGLSGAVEGDSARERLEVSPRDVVPQGGSTSLKPTSDRLPIGPDPRQTEGMSDSIETGAVDAVIQSLWSQASVRVIESPGQLPPCPPKIGPTTISIDSGPSTDELMHDGETSAKSLRPIHPRVGLGSPSREEPRRGESSVVAALMVSVTSPHSWVSRRILANRSRFPARSGERSPIRRKTLLGST